MSYFFNTSWYSVINAANESYFLNNRLRQTPVAISAVMENRYSQLFNVETSGSGGTHRRVNH
jgi:hypothetical protein